MSQNQLFLSCNIVLRKGGGTQDKDEKELSHAANDTKHELHRNNRDQEALPLNLVDVGWRVVCINRCQLLF